MARKGDSVAPTLEALLSLKFRRGIANKVYTGNVTNAKNFLPLHIAAMSSICPKNILRILKSDFERGFRSRTCDGSLPLHIACQYSSDPNLLATLLYYDSSAVINERRQVYFLEFLFRKNGMLRHSLGGEVMFFFFAAYYGFLLELTALFVCLSCSWLPACPPDVGGRQWGQYKTAITTVNCLLPIYLG